MHGISDSRKSWDMCFDDRGSLKKLDRPMVSLILAKEIVVETNPVNRLIIDDGNSNKWTNPNRLESPKASIVLDILTTWYTQETSFMIR